MAKKYRVKDKNGNSIVKTIYGGHAASGQVEMDVAKTLNGKTPAQHCAEMIKKYKGGYFETKDEGLDVCNLPTPSFFGGTTMGPEYNYYYAVCEEIEFTAKLNDKPTTAKELAKLKGGERVIISANQEVTWVVPNAAKLEKTAQNGNTFAFTMPKSGRFTIKAAGRCDPKASKTIAVQAIEKTIDESKEPVLKLSLTNQNIHDIIKVVSTEVALDVKNEEERKRQAKGVIDTILNRIYLAKQNKKTVRSVLNAKGQFSKISGSPDAFGSVEKMPDKEIRPWTAKFTEEYLKERTTNPHSSIGGNYNYLNPHSKSVSEDTMRKWGNDVVEQAKKSGLIFGEGNSKHYHGTAKGHKMAPSFIVVIPKSYQYEWSK